jgi:hypothetical protein
MFRSGDDSLTHHQGQANDGDGVTELSLAKPTKVRRTVVKSAVAYLQEIYHIAAEEVELNFEMNEERDGETGVVCCRDSQVGPDQRRNQFSLCIRNHPELRNALSLY